MQIGNQARQKVTPVIFAIILEDRVFQQLFCPEWAFLNISPLLFLV